MTYYSKNKIEIIFIYSGVDSLYQKMSDIEKQMYFTMHIHTTKSCIHIHTEFKIIKSNIFKVINMKHYPTRNRISIRAPRLISNLLISESNLL